MTLTVPCIVKMCRNYFSTRKKIIGSLLVFYVKNATTFHDQLAMGLMEKHQYTIDMVNQYSLCTEECYYNHHFIEKAMNYLIIFTFLNEIHDAVYLW